MCHVHLNLDSVKGGFAARGLTSIRTDARINEVEILVLLLDGGHHGVNVANVREIITPSQLTRLPESRSAVRGVFRLREHVLPQIDLRAYFGMTPSEDESAARVIVTGFNGERRGFLVDHVEWIHRISWSDPSEVRYESGDGDLAIKSVVPAADGEEARTGLNELIECASPPDIVVIDIEMPRMDGSKLTKRT